MAEHRRLTEGAKLEKALYDTVRPPGVTDERIIGQKKIILYLFFLAFQLLEKNWENILFEEPEQVLIQIKIKDVKKWKGKWRKRLF